MLITHPQSKYSELKPRHMEGSKFTYHLQKMINQQLVQKNQDGTYSLTSKGKLFADRFELDTLTVLEQPRIVCLVACYEPSKGWLLFTRNQQPTIHMAGFAKVDVEFGSMLHDQVSRAFTDLSGLEVALNYRAHGYVTQKTPDGELESRVMIHLYYGENPSGELRLQTDSGTFGWYLDDELTNMPNLIPSTVPLMTKLQQSPSPFFFEETYQLA